MIFNRPPGDKMDDIDKHSLVWGAIYVFHNERSRFSWDFSDNLHSTRNTDEKPTVKKLFEVTQKLI